MNQRIAQITLVVREYEEAIEFYTQRLGFTLLEETKLRAEKRWVLVAPPEAGGCCLLLAKAVNGEQAKCIGNQAGGRVFLFLYTDDFWGDYERMADRGVKFTSPPREEGYGRVAVFQDLYGNLWDLLELSEKN